MGRIPAITASFAKANPKRVGPFLSHGYMSQRLNFTNQNVDLPLNVTDWRHISKHLSEIDDKKRLVTADPVIKSQVDVVLANNILTKNSRSVPEPIAIPNITLTHSAAL